ncbi:MAG: hypothetical protein EXR99_04925 [Gemmataceae bacterium]|nr:hypothetical protein [Gemmataceae bacterium]
MAAKVKKETQVWVITHCEISGKVFDRWPFHVAGSLEAAKKLIPRVKVSDYSWWEVFLFDQNYDIYKHGWEEPKVYYFNHLGKAVKTAPFNKAVKAFQKSSQPSSQAGGCCGQATG